MKNLTRLLEQKPSWIVLDEPVSASTSPATQDVNILPDGTIIHNVEGVANRTAAQLWGSVKLLAAIIDNEHNDDGSHNMGNDSIAADAAIEETKIDMAFVGEERPSGGVYATTKDVTDEIAHWSPFYRVSIDHAALARGKERMDMAQNFHKNGFVGTTIVPAGNEDRVMIADDEHLWIKGHRLCLRGTLSNTTQCFLDLGSAPSAMSVAISRQLAVWVEVWEHNVTETGVYFPYGNTQYKNESEAATPAIPYTHTSEKLLLSNEQEAAHKLADPDNNLFIGEFGDVWQLVYRLRFAQVEYNPYEFGVNDPSVRTLTNQPLTKVAHVSTLWQSADGTMVHPLAIIIRRNQGIYHEAVNPAGCSVKRDGTNTPTTLVQCFERSRIGYFNAGVECPDYASAEYNTTNDTYTFGDVVYIRSSLKDSGVTARPDLRYSDVVDRHDVDLIKPKYMVESRIPDYFIGKLLSSQIRNRITQIEYGTTSDVNRADYWGVNPLQVMGLGSSESATFGTNNIGGIFVDKTNNYETGHIDGVRTVWSDKETTRVVAFSFVQGNGGSETKPQLNTYEPLSRTVALNTTGLSGDPTIGTSQPKLLWEDGSNVILSSPWTGLGSGSASCTMQAADVNAHLGQTVSCSCELTYAKGSGIPFVLNQVVKVEDFAKHKLSWSNIGDPLNHIKFITPASPTVDTILLPNTAVITDDFYKDMWVVVVNSTSVETGTLRKIVSYDGSMRVATLDQPLPSALSQDSVITLSQLPIENYSHIQFDPFARGVHRAIRRALFTANTNGVVTVGRNILFHSAGNANSVMLTGLASGQVVDVIFEEDSPFTQGIKVWLHNTDLKTIYSPVPEHGAATIINIGKSLITNLGSANNGDTAYLHLIPGSSTPTVDGEKWVGTVNNQRFYSISVVENLGLSWENIIPYAGMILDYSNLEIDTYLDGALLQLVSASQVAKNSGLILSAMLVSDIDGYKLLVAQTVGDVLTFANRQKVWVIDLSKLVSFSDLI